MKKFIAIMLMLVCICSLWGCNVASDTETTNETQPPEITVLHTTDTYTIRCVGAQCYLDMTAGNKKQETDDIGCVIPMFQLEFDSIAQMHRTLTEGTLSGSQLEAISFGFPLQEHGFLIPDPRQLYEPKFPDGMATGRVYLQGAEYSVILRKSGSINHGQLTIQTEEAYLKSFSHYEKIVAGEIEFDSSYVSDRNATAYDYTTNAARARKLLYRLEADGKVLYVIEDYRLEWFDGRTASQTDPVEMTVYGQENGGYFTLQLSLNKRLDEQTILSFGLDPLGS